MADSAHDHVPRAGWTRLLAAVQPGTTSHAVEADLLGQYAALQRRRGPEAATLAFPQVATHLVESCPTCDADLAELVAILDADGREDQPGWLDVVRQRVERARLPAVADEAAEIVVEIEYVIPHYPELLLRVSREYNGSLARLVVHQEAHDAAPHLYGWEVNVSIANLESDFKGATNAGGVARLAWLPLETLVDARVSVRPPTTTTR
jgi:hypothetical protein